MSDLESNLSGLADDILALARMPLPTYEGRIITVNQPAGRVTSVTVQLDSGATVTVPPFGGIDTPHRVGDLWQLELQGGTVDPQLVLVRKLDGRRTPVGFQENIDLPAVLLPGASLGGIYTESATATAENPNAVNDPGGITQAAVWLYPRSFVLGEYNLYREFLLGFRLQLRLLNDIEWQTADVGMHPGHRTRLRLPYAITENQTSFQVITNDDTGNELLVDQPAFWMIQGEILLGLCTANPDGTFTITVKSHNGIDPAVLGAGFITNAAGRGLEGTTARSHPATSDVWLLSCTVPVTNLRPGFAYQARIACLNHNNQTGPYSQIVGFTSWRQLAKPSPPGPLDVIQEQGSIYATWPPVRTDVAGNPRDDISAYRVVRAAAPLTVTLPFFSSPGVTGVRDTAGVFVYAESQEATAARLPTALGTGNYVGVQAVDSSGNESDWTWDNDAGPPPRPHHLPLPGVELDAEANGMHFRIDPTVVGEGTDPRTGQPYAYSPRNAPGFQGYVVYRQSGTPTAPANLTLMPGVWSDDSFVLPTDPTGPYFWQVAARDFAGNISPLANDANHWLRDDAVPGALFSVYVTSVQAGFSLFYPKINDFKVITYRITRATSAAVDGSGNPATASVLADTGLTYRDVTDNFYLWPASVGAGNFFHVRAIGLNGKLGPWSIGADTAPPPTPAGVTFLEGPGRVTVQVPIGDISFTDEGFKEYVLWSATSDGGAIPLATRRFRAQALVYEVDPYTTRPYYQLQAVDWVGNATPLAAGGWVYANADYPTDTYPANGTFNERDDDPAALGFPKWWRRSTWPNVSGQHYTIGVYETTGLRGSRAVWMELVADGISPFGGVEALLIPVNPYRSAQLSFFVRFNVVNPSGQTLMQTRIVGYSSVDNWRSAITAGSWTSVLSAYDPITLAVDTPAIAGKWYRCDTGVLDLSSLVAAGTRYVQVAIAPGSHPAGMGLTIDDVVMTFGA